MAEPLVSVVGIDHVVLRVSDAEKSAAWYRDELGLRPERLEEWRAGTVFFPSVRVHESFIVDLLVAPRGPRDNVDHICFEIAPGTDLQALADSGRFEIVDGPTEPRFGAKGNARSLYVRDPDGNVVELRAY